MTNQAVLISTLFEKTERFTKTTAELYKLKVIDKSADVISTLSARLAVILFITLFVLVLNIGIGLLIGEILGGSYYGFFIIAGFYVLIALALFVFGGKWIKEPVRNCIIAQALK